MFYEAGWLDCKPARHPKVSLICTNTGLSQSAGFALLRRAKGDWLYNINLKVYDLLGREVITLVNEQQRPGEYTVKFDGSHLSSGVYFYMLEAGRLSETKKLILFK